MSKHRVFVGARIRDHSFVCWGVDQGITAATAKEGEVVRWDAIRTLRMLAVGLFMSGPSLHLWFGSVAKLYPNRDLYSTLKKLVLGQVIFGPLFCAAFFSINAFAQGATIPVILECVFCRSAAFFSINLMPQLWMIWANCNAFLCSVGQ